MSKLEQQKALPRRRPYVKIDPQHFTNQALLAELNPKRKPRKAKKAKKR